MALNSGMRPSTRPSLLTIFLVWNAAGMAALPNAWHGLSFKSNNATVSVTNAQISNNLFAGNSRHGMYANELLKAPPHQQSLMERFLA